MTFFYDVPEHTREALELWIKEGQMPGAFVRSVLENDLVGATCRADTANAPRLVSIVQYLNMEAPSSCWGSREKVLAWALHFAQRCREKLNEGAQVELWSGDELPPFGVRCELERDHTGLHRRGEVGWKKGSE